MYVLMNAVNYYVLKQNVIQNYDNNFKNLNRVINSKKKKKKI